MQPLLPRSIDDVTYHLRGSFAAGFGVFDAEPQQVAELCTPRSTSSLTQ